MLRGDDYHPWRITEETPVGRHESDCIEKRRHSSSRKNEPRGEGRARSTRLYEYISQANVDAPNSLITVPCRMHELRRKRKKQAMLRISTSHIILREIESAEEIIRQVFLLVYGNGEPFING